MCYIRDNLRFNLIVELVLSVLHFKTYIDVKCNDHSLMFPLIYKINLLYLTIYLTIYISSKIASLIL